MLKMLNRNGMEKLKCFNRKREFFRCLLISVKVTRSELCVCVCVCVCVCLKAKTDLFLSAGLEGITLCRGSNSSSC